MKKILLVILLSSPFLVKSQKISFYGLINPVAVIPNGKGLAPGGFVGAGTRIGRWSAIGLKAGYFKPAGENGIAPVGLEYNFTDFGRKKIMPAISAHILYPIHSGEGETTTNGNGDYYGTKKRLDGRIMVGGTVGVSLPWTVERKLVVSVGYSYLSIKDIPLKEKLSGGMLLLSIAAII
jgi:hypothetical protein